MPDENRVLQLFQSLFFWMTPIKLILFCTNSKIFKFQSLFFWMTPIKVTVPGRLCVIHWFQSLFFWMTPIKKKHNASEGYTYGGFNPCSSG